MATPNIFDTLDQPERYYYSMAIIADFKGIAYHSNSFQRNGDCKEHPRAKDDDGQVYQAPEHTSVSRDQRHHGYQEWRSDNRKDKFVCKCSVEPHKS